MILCPGCGADMRYDPKESRLTCEYCKTALTVKEYRKMRSSRPGLTDLDRELTAKAQKVPSSSAEISGVDPRAEEDPDGSFSVTVFTCPQCGAALMSMQETAATFCSYCGASVTLEGRLSREKRPERIIPFSVTGEQCREAYRKLLKKSLFIPSEMKEQDRIEKFRGIYMPYWIYNFTQNGPVCLTGKKVSRKKDVETTDFYEISLPAEAECKGISFDSSSIFFDNLSDSIAPFYPEKGESFDPGYLSGFYADTGDLRAEAYREKARSMAAEKLGEEIGKACNLKEFSVDRYSIEEKLEPDIQAQNGLFPVWFLSTRIRRKKGKEDRISYAVVNGQTGKIFAELPVDFKKYVIGCLLLAIPVYILLNLFFTPTPARMLIAAAVLAVAGIILSNVQTDRIGWRDLHADDIGQTIANAADPDGVYSQLNRKERLYLKTKQRLWLMAIIMFGSWLLALALFIAGFSDFLPSMLALLAIPLGGLFLCSKIPSKRVKQKDKRASVVPFRKKLRACWKQIAGLAVIMTVLIARPVSDLYYYGAAAVSMIMTGWSFYSIVQEYNELTTRKIPQLGKRGGDDHE